MGQLMRAVSALQKHGLDTADSNLLRDRVERTYAKPWQVNARIDEATSVPPPPPPQTEEETTRLKATKNHEKPWRHMAKPPAPPAEFEVTGTALGARRRPWSRPRRPGRRRPTWSARRPSRTTCPSRHADHRCRSRPERRAHAAERLGGRRRRARGRSHGSHRFSASTQRHGSSLLCVDGASARRKRFKLETYGPRVVQILTDIVPVGPIVLPHQAFHVRTSTAHEPPRQPQPGTQ